MAPFVDEHQEEWIGVRRAAEAIGCSPYCVQKFAVVGKIRVKLLPPFRTLYSRTDAETVGRSFASSRDVSGATAAAL